MIKLLDARWLACIIMLQSNFSNSEERSLTASVATSVVYNDNVFLTTGVHDGVSGYVVTPKFAGIIEETNWKTILNARIRSNNYADRSLDSNDQYFNLMARYTVERDVFSINVNYDLDSNLNSSSTDFGVVRVRINRKSRAISPQYTRLLTERLLFSLSYSYTMVDYIDAVNTGFTPYVTNSTQFSLNYDLTEKNKLTFSLQGVDYASEDDSVTYQLLTFRLGVTHKFSKILSLDILAGSSRRDASNLNTQVFDFFGNIITVPQEINSKNSDFVMNAGLIRLFENGSLTGRVSRNNSTNSLGGLNQVDQFKVSYNRKVSSLWEYGLDVGYKDITAISSNNQSADRDTFSFVVKTAYSISRYWKINASYRYLTRQFKSDVGVAKPDSNRVSIGLNYNFPVLSSF